MKVLTLYGNSYHRAINDLCPLDHEVTEFMENPETYDAVLFTGGADVSPSLYNDTSPEGLCYCDAYRDKLELEVFNKALQAGVRMTGICRGLQFLCAMAGGKLIHHLDNHSGGRHNMETLTGEVFEVNSLHHQMAMPPKDSFIIGWSENKRSKRYFGEEDKLVNVPKEVEAVIFPNIGAAAVQYHPEMMDEESRGYTWYHELVEDLLKLDMNNLISKYTTRKTKCMNITAV